MATTNQSPQPAEPSSVSAPRAPSPSYSMTSTIAYIKTYGTPEKVGYVTNHKRDYKRAARVADYNAFANYTPKLPIGHMEVTEPYVARGPGQTTTPWEDEIIEALSISREQYLEARARIFEAFVYFREARRHLAKSDTTSIMHGLGTTGNQLYEKFNKAGWFRDSVINALTTVRKEHYRSFPTEDTLLEAALEAYLNREQH